MKNLRVRVWNIKKAEWINTNHMMFFHSEDDNSMFQFGYMGIDNFKFVDHFKITTIYNPYRGGEIKPNTVYYCQDTGYKDKNGQDVFVDDVLSIGDGSPGILVKVPDIYTDIKHKCGVFDAVNLGSLHENPELINEII